MPSYKMELGTFKELIEPICEVAGVEPAEVFAIEAKPGVIRVQTEPAAGAGHDWHGATLTEDHWLVVRAPEEPH